MVYQGNRMKKKKKYVIIDQKELVNNDKILLRIKRQQTAGQNKAQIGRSSRNGDHSSNSRSRALERNSYVL